LSNKNVFRNKESSIFDHLTNQKYMKRYLLILLFAAFLCSCGNNAEPGSSGGSSDVNVSNSPDTIKVDRVANRDMMIILSILPDTLSKSFQWTRTQRGTMRESVEKNGFLVDSNEVFKSVNLFKNNHIDLTLPYGKFLLTTYQIRDGHYVIVTVETSKEKQTVHAYELYKSSAAELNLDELLGKYSLNFMADPSNQTCLGMLYDKNPIFNFSISEDDTLTIKISNYDEGNAKGCLKGNLMTLKFNSKQMPFDLQEISWED
jgi:hypothetical protein